MAKNGGHLLSHHIDVANWTTLPERRGNNNNDSDNNRKKEKQRKSGPPLLMQIAYANPPFIDSSISKSALLVIPFETFVRNITQQQVSYRFTS
jgi:hypothetical protein